MAWDQTEGPDPNDEWVFFGGTADGTAFWRRSGPFDDLLSQWWEDDERSPGIPLDLPPERDVLTIAPNDYL